MASGVGSIQQVASVAPSGHGIQSINALSVATMSLAMS